MFMNLYLKVNKVMKLRYYFLISLVILLCGISIGLLIYHHWVIDIVIDKRAEGLGMMQYSGKQNKMIAKEEHKWILKYLKDGTMEY